MKRTRISYRKLYVRDEDLQPATPEFSSDDFAVGYVDYRDAAPWVREFMKRFGFSTVRHRRPRHSE
jgi:hypothetical protein